MIDVVVGSPCCPVCWRPIGAAEMSCASCAWELSSGYRFGSLTDADHRAFADRLAAAERGFDAAAAARGAGYPDRGDPDRRARLEAFVRAGPVTDADRRRVPSQRTHSEPDDQPTAGPVVEIDIRGITASVFREGPGGARVEEAALAGWSWSDLVPSLSRDPDERRFQLAGGIGAGGFQPAAARSELAAGLPAGIGAGPETVTVVCDLPDWPLPGQAADLIRAARPGSTAGHRGSGRRVTTAPAGITAFASATGDHSGTTIVIGARDGSIALVALATGELVAGFAAHDGRVTSVSVVGDGEAVASGGQDGSVRVGRPGQSKATVLGWHNGWVNAVAAGERVVFSLGDDGQLRRYALAAGGGPEFTLEVGWSAATTLACSAEVVAYGGGGSVTLVDATTGELITQIAVGAPVASMAMDRTGRLLAVGDVEGRAHVVSVAAKTVRTTFRGHDGPVRAVGFGTDDALLTGDEAGIVRRVPLRSGRATGPVRIIGAHRTQVRGVTTTADGGPVSAAADGLIRVWGAAALPRRQDTEFR